MNRFFKLVHVELTRFRFIYFALFIVTIALQFIGLGLYASSYMNKARQRMDDMQLTAADYVQTYGSTNLFDYVNHSLWFMGSIALCIAALLIYVFFIWYRDWLGKNMFVYRLLMLPTKRANIYLAKITVILLAVFGLVALQLCLLPLLKLGFNAWIPASFRTSVSVMDIIHNHTLLKRLLPRTLVEFILHYGMGFMAVTIVFAGILLERSFRWKGLIASLIYGGLAVVFFFSPFFVWDVDLFYPLELFGFLTFTGLTVTGVSLWFGFYLLNKKVSV